MTCRDGIEGEGIFAGRRCGRACGSSTRVPVLRTLKYSSMVQRLSYQVTMRCAVVASAPVSVLISIQSSGSLPLGRVGFRCGHGEHVDGFPAFGLARRREFHPVRRAVRALPCVRVLPALPPQAAIFTVLSASFGSVATCSHRFFLLARFQDDPTPRRTARAQHQQSRLLCAGPGRAMSRSRPSPIADRDPPVSWGRRGRGPAPAHVRAPSARSRCLRHRRRGRWHRVRTQPSGRARLVDRQADMRQHPRTHPVPRAAPARQALPSP